MSLSVEEAPFNALWSYWQDIRGERLLPDSRDIDLTRLAAVLPNVSVLDIKSPEEVLYRHVGSNIVERFGDELTGVNLLEIFSEKSRALLSQSLVETVTRPVAGFCQTSITYQSGRKALTQILSTPIKTAAPSLGRTLMLQRTIQKGQPKAGDVVSVIGSDHFSTRFIDIGAGAGSIIEAFV